MTQLQLDTLEIKNFKCFNNFNVQFGKLTVLSGYNGAGKSTSIQPILLLAQMLNDSPKKIEERGKNWPLNGSFIRLGSVGDVLYSDNGEYDERTVEFNFGLSNKQYFSCKFDVKSGNRYLASRKINKKLLNSMEFISRLNYISALRGNNENLYPRPDNSDYSEVQIGVDGRFASFLYNEKVDHGKFRKDVDDWLKLIAVGAKASVLPLSSSRFFELNFNMSATLDEMLPINVGYGLTYAFPIIVASLAANVGDLIIIDSPEAHLHPRAQSRMGWKLAEIAARGVQIILETHSDHILNGIRLAVKEKILKPKELELLFFSGATDGTDGVSRPKIDRNGTLNEWPIGFFDQNEIDLAKLIGVN